MSEQAVGTLEAVLERGGEPDDVLRAAVRVLAEQPGIAWAGIAFLEEGELVLGPSAGEADETRRVRLPVTFDGSQVGELWVDGEAERSFLEQVALLVSGHVLIGWDTRGEGWDP